MDDILPFAFSDQLTALNTPEVFHHTIASNLPVGTKAYMMVLESDIVPTGLDANDAVIEAILKANGATTNTGTDISYTDSILGSKIYESRGVGAGAHYGDVGTKIHKYEPYTEELPISNGTLVITQALGQGGGSAAKAACSRRGKVVIRRPQNNKTG
jgi:hypothetical protein